MYPRPQKRKISEQNERFLRTKMTFNYSLMVSVGVSKLDCTGLIFVRVKIDENVLLWRAWFCLSSYCLAISFFGKWVTRVSEWVEFYVPLDSYFRDESLQASHALVYASYAKQTGKNTPKHKKNKETTKQTTWPTISTCRRKSRQKRYILNKTWTTI